MKLAEPDGDARRQPGLRISGPARGILDGWGTAQAPVRSRAGSEAPDVVVLAVSVRAGPEARPSAARIVHPGRPARRRTLGALALALAIAVLPAVWPGDRSARQETVNALARQIGPSGVAAAFGYPPACLSVTILAGTPTYARADFNHLSRCGRYAGYATAIFHYVAGEWRLVLDAIQYPCPLDWLPTTVQSGLDVCQELSGQRRTINR